MLTDQSIIKSQNLPQINVPVINPSDVVQSENKLWSISIPRINKIFLVISLLLVFGLDLILIISDSSLMSFWLAMFAVLVVFLLFFYFENKVLSKKFSNSKTTLDSFISFAIVLRNIVILLNFIPFIQLLGLAIVIFTGVPYLLIYGLLVRSRYKRS